MANATTYKIGVIVGNNSITVVDNTGYYDDDTNPSGWGYDSNNPDIIPISSNGITNITKVRVAIDRGSEDTLSIEASASDTSTKQYWGILPGSEFSNLLTPDNLVFTISPSTIGNSVFNDFSTYLSDGVSTVSVILTFGNDLITAEKEIFIYKTIEEEVWDMFHKVATQYFNKKGMDEYLEKCLFAYTNLKGLEYICLTTLQDTNFSNALAKLEDLQRFMDYMDINTK